MINNEIFNCLEVIGKQEGVSLESLKLNLKGSTKAKNNCIRFLVHRKYIYKTSLNKFFLSDLGREYYKNNTNNTDIILK